MQAAPLGPCGTPWESPFSADASMGAKKALGILEALPDSFRGDPKVSERRNKIKHQHLFKIKCAVFFW
jgi:hypothetical protein